jgi:hypothetical protein
MIVSIGGRDPLPVSGSRVIYLTQLNQCTSESAVGAALIVSEGEVFPELPDSVIPLLQALVLKRESEVGSGIVRVCLDHSLQRFESGIHVSGPFGQRVGVEWSDF